MGEEKSVGGKGGEENGERKNGRGKKGLGKKEKLMAQNILNYIDVKNGR